MITPATYADFQREKHLLTLTRDAAALPSGSVRRVEAIRKLAEASASAYATAHNRVIWYEGPFYSPATASA